MHNDDEFMKFMALHGNTDGPGHDAHYREARQTLEGVMRGMISDCVDLSDEFIGLSLFGLLAAKLPDLPDEAVSVATGCAAALFLRDLTDGDKAAILSGAPITLRGGRDGR